MPSLLHPSLSFPSVVTSHRPSRLLPIFLWAPTLLLSQYDRELKLLKNIYVSQEPSFLNSSLIWVRTKHTPPEALRVMHEYSLVTQERSLHFVLGKRLLSRFTGDVWCLYSREERTSNLEFFVFGDNPGVGKISAVHKGFTYLYSQCLVIAPFKAQDKTSISFLLLTYILDKSY